MLDASVAPQVGAPTHETVGTWPLGPEDYDSAARWLHDETNAKWLGFGAGTGVPTPSSLEQMFRRGHHCVWVYGPAPGRTPAGLVALGNIQPRFRTAEAWFVLGEKEHARRELTVGAMTKLLEHGFTTLELRCVYAWTVEINRGGRRVLERLGFRLAGRLRESHRIGDRAYDRLLFDLLAHEFRGVARE